MATKTKKKAARKPASSTNAKSKAGSSGSKSKTASKSKPKSAAAAKPNASDQPVAKKPAATKRMSALDAAAQVLKEAKTPMGCKDLTEVILKRGLWQTSGKTPAATLYAAIIREIDRKRKESRFEKVERGVFSLRKGA